MKVIELTVRERILGLRLLEGQRRNPEYAQKLGISVEMVSRENSTEQKENIQNLQNNNA